MRFYERILIIMFETIVALATPPMKSALAIIRLSGDDVLTIVSKCFTRNIENITKKEMYYGSIVNNEQKIDDVVLLAYKGPKSFTGEVISINHLSICHQFCCD